MKKSMVFIATFSMLLLLIGCMQVPQPKTTEKVDLKTDCTIAANGDLHIRLEDQDITMEINALPDGQILEDEDQRLLILTDPTDRYQHGILGDVWEPTSVTMVQLSDKPAVISKFTIPDDWVIESILPYGMIGTRMV